MSAPSIRSASNADDVLSGPQARVLATVLYLHQRGERLTIGAVQEAAGYASTSDVHTYLKQLRKLGLVAFEDGRAATLRPAVTIHQPKENE